MPPVRPHVSITLPRNFTFHYADGQAPRTPEPEPKEEDIEPPAPPRQTFRLRRKRAAIPTPDTLDSAPREHSIPTIETPDPASQEYLPLPEFNSEISIGCLAPVTPLNRPISPPKTPVGQIAEYAGARAANDDWHMTDESFPGESISRPSSAYSSISNSSMSSRGSADSFHSRGGSCTSPDSDTADPFMFPTFKSSTAMVTSPLDQSFDQRPMKRLRIRRTASWTEEMDNHLWIIYLKYLQDPTVTPFKMLPGTAPPLGVCHRVAREAKRSWKGPKHVVSLRNASCLHPRRSQRAGSPDTLRAPKSGSNTPTRAQIAGPYAQWPRSESATRRRLRHLCKRTPTLSAHYQRLLHGRSPSPFSSSSPHSKSDPKEESVIPTSPSTASEPQSAFARDMHISLATSTAASMQPGGPLSQLASDITPRPARNRWATEPRSRLAAHQKGQSLQLEFGFDGNQVQRQSRTLGSAFSTAPRRPPINTSFFQPQTQPEQSEPPAPRLESPLQLHAPVPLPRSFKRRAHHQLEELLNPSSPAHRRSGLLEELFGPPAEISHRRVRSRGFSFGDAGDGTSGAQRLSALFEPPTESHSAALSTSNPGPSGDTLVLASPADHIRRLASPFEERSHHATQFNTFPRSFSHSTSYDPTASFNSAFSQLASSDPFTSPMHG